MISVLVASLATAYKSGSLVQLEAIARSMLAAVPEDVVALQFLGLALFQMGRVDDAHLVFKMVAATLDQQEELDGSTVCEPAYIATYRAATRAHSGLADGWYRIGQALNKYGFHKPATRAFEAELASRGCTETERRRNAPR